MSNPIKVSTIIVSYNTAELTSAAIKSVIDNYREDNINGEIIVVDNNSKDDSVNAIKAQFSNQIIIIENNENTGYAIANNQGIHISRGDFIFLLNSDTVVHPHAVKQYLSSFERYPDNYQTQQLQQTKLTIDRLGIVSGQLLNPDGSLQPQGIALPNLLNIATWWIWPLPGDFPFLPPLKSYHYLNTDIYSKENSFGWVAGTAMMIKREVVEEIGVLDEKIFMYAEDVEFCLRARKHHWDVLYTPLAKITHYGSASSSLHNAAIKEIIGLKYVVAKHHPSWQLPIFHFIFLLGASLRWLLFGIILNNVEKKHTFAQIIAALQKGK